MPIHDAARRSPLLAAVLVTLVGCAKAPEAVPVPPVKLPALAGVTGGERLVADLDATGDGVVDAADAALFDEVAVAARQRLGSDVGPASGYYQGPPAAQKPVWRDLRFAGQTADLSRVVPARLRELAIEMHWMAQQARLAHAASASGAASIGGLLHGSVPGYDADRMEPAALCAATRQLDTSVFARAGQKAAAIFDVDSTLWAGNGTEVFLAALIQEKALLPEGNAPVQAFLKTVPGVNPKVVAKNDVYKNAKLLLDRSSEEFLPVEGRIGAKDSFYNIVALLRGQTPGPVRAAARVAILAGAGKLPAWKSRVYADRDGCGMAQVVKNLQASGVDVYLLSATPDAMVEEAGRLFGLPDGHALGSVLEVKNGRYTGEVQDNTYYVKSFITRQWLPGPPLLAFGDSPTSDFAMLQEAVGAGFMVNPRREFEARDQEEAHARFVGLHFDATEGEVARAP